MSPATRSSLFTSVPPAVAVEIAPGRVTAVALAAEAGGRVVSAYASELLPPTAVDPALNATNVHDAAALAEAIRGVLQRVDARARRIALVLPDTIAKVTLLRFDNVPPKVQDLDQLIRWQVRKAAPFRIEDAQVAWIEGVALPEGGREFVVTVARRDVIESYERACEAAGVHAGLVDLASFNLINAALASWSGAAPAGDWLFVHVRPEYDTLAIVRGANLVFFRNRAAAGEGDLSDLVHQTAMYHEDRLGGGGFVRVVVAGASSADQGQAERVRRGIADRLGVTAEPLDFRSAAPLRDRIGVGPDLLDALGPGVGVLLREQVA